jgi:hypothetical protein
MRVTKVRVTKMRVNKMYHRDLRSYAVSSYIIAPAHRECVAAALEGGRTNVDASITQRCMGRCLTDTDTGKLPAVGGGRRPGDPMGGGNQYNYWGRESIGLEIDIYPMHLQFLVK